MEVAGKIDYYAIAKKLAKLPANTDSRDWPEASKFLYELNLPLIWSQICLLAFGLARNEVIKIWLLLEYVNGWRRQGGKWDIEIALYTLDEIKRRIDRLPDYHPRKGRLLEMWLYHSGLVDHTAGKFSEAADCHEIAAQRADNEWGRLLSLFYAAMERLNAAICGKGKIALCHDRFTEACSHFKGILNGSSDNILRWRANVFCHQLFYSWVVKGRYPRDFELGAIKGLPEKLRPAFVDAARVLDALCEFPASSQRALEITSQIPPEAEVDWGSFAILVRISALGKTEAIERFVAIGKLEEFLESRHGGHIARAILEHNLLK